MSWIERVCQRLPNLHAKSFFFTHGNILINDLMIEDAESALACVEFTVPMQIFDGRQLTKDLESLIDLPSFASVILPGNGSRIVQQHLTSPVRSISVDAKRVGYKNPKPEINDFTVPDGSVAVLDDVVSSGDTAHAIFVKGIWRPATLATWILQYPRGSRLSCYESIVASLCVGGEKGKVPVNSLSTLIANRDIAQSYAERFCTNQYDFFAALELIQEAQGVV